MAYAQKIVFRAREGDAQKYNGQSPSPNKGVRQGARSFTELNNDDPQVCLNCTREKCNGTDECYRKEKEKREKDSH